MTFARDAVFLFAGTLFGFNVARILLFQDSLRLRLTPHALPSPNYENKSCSLVLAKLGKIWDEKREARRATRAVDKDDPIQFFDLYEPEADCITEERFGGDDIRRYRAYGDGPKFICGVDFLASQKDCLIYSIGSRNQIDFEASVKRFLGCETHTFDPTIDHFVGGEYAEWHPWGLGKDGRTMTFHNKTFQAMSLETIYKKLGHMKEQRKIDVLKIDCEGCEWEAVPPIFSAIARGKMQIDQIQIEIHQVVTDEVLLRRFFEAADIAKMRIFHKERNHWGCDGYKCVEYAFVSESFLMEATAWTIC